MTQQELDELKGAVLLEYHQVESELRALEVKCRRLGEAICSFGELVKDPLQKLFRSEQQNYGLLVTTTPNTLIDAVRQWESSFDLADQIRKARKRLDTLERQKRGLGL